MAVYSVWLQILMQLFGQLTPTELALHFPSSTYLFLAQNLTLLVFVGGGTVHFLGTLIDKARAERIALFVITSLFHISATSCYLFLATRLVLRYKSYEGLRRYLVATADFRRPPFNDRRFKLIITLFIIVMIAARTLNAVIELLESDSTDFMYMAGSIATLTSHAYSLLYAAKLTLITRHVKLHFLQANRLLLGCFKHLQNLKFCTFSKAEFEKLIQYQWNGHDFLDKVNTLTGLDWFVLMFYLYLGILFRLYNAFSFLALFHADDPQLGKAQLNMGLALLNMIMSLILMRNGNAVSGEVRHTTEIIWNAIPKIKCNDCKQKFSHFADHVSHLSADMTANRIFTLNMKTYSNMTSSAATQLVILISLGNRQT